MNAIVKFQEKELELVNIDGNAYMRSSDVARALGYENTDSVTKIFNRNKDEFYDEMSLTVNLTVKGFGGGNSKKPVRVFNMRGCHLIAMLSDTPVAKAFRAWCLDILEGKIVLPFGNKQPRAVTPVDLAAIGGTVKRCVAKVMREEMQALMKQQKPISEEERLILDNLRAYGKKKYESGVFYGLIEGAFSQSDNCKTIRECLSHAKPRTA